MSKQQTALQQFHEAILSGKITDTLANIDYYLELERQQIIDAWCDGSQPDIDNKIFAEQYYNEIFGK